MSGGLRSSISDDLEGLQEPPPLNRPSSLALLERDLFASRCSIIVLRLLSTISIEYIFLLISLVMLLALLTAL